MAPGLWWRSTDAGGLKGVSRPAGGDVIRRAAAKREAEPLRTWPTSAIGEQAVARQRGRRGLRSCTASPSSESSSTSLQTPAPAAQCHGSIGLLRGCAVRPGRSHPPSLVVTCTEASTNPVGHPWTVFGTQDNGPVIATSRVRQGSTRTRLADDVVVVLDPSACTRLASSKWTEARRSTTRSPTPTATEHQAPTTIPRTVASPRP